MVYIYFLIGVVANRILVSPLTKWTARVEKAEGDFRYKHVSVRNNAEESSFYNAAEFEEFESNRFLMRLLKRQFTATLWRYPAQFLQNYFDYYGAIISYLVQIFPIFILNSYKDMDGPTLAQQISNNAFFFIYLINSFTRLTDLALAVGEMAGYSQSALKANSELFFLPTPQVAQVSDSLLPSLPPGFSNNYEKEQIFLLVDQRPYFPPGNLSLRQQIVFPQLDNGKDYTEEIDNNEIINILESLHLRTLLSMCGGLTDPANFEWQDTLSPGEQQRLSLARVLYHKPSFVFLDEATSSLSADAEANVYKLLEKYGISYMSVGHRSTLRSFHDVELQLLGKHEWKLLQLDGGEELEAQAKL
ncbi:hypothetical protein OESDEN_05086 [Oesophagostomum dentatum]|uniref:ABC transporter, ATP-binding protein n=1 Tax=Oesophagostomum dentatum TaxID=61180 RepID=A0A0B1TFS7_OESDE|nr:hypothetical protein OESDEN_05086 [Oesophagostomum dentatum]